ncbi:MAG: PEGA domain-containing protein [Deltaproteobacteria bacterium]|nr:PEGA domain-containing protein [Deltaproteobacteria bacterium]
MRFIILASLLFLLPACSEKAAPVEVGPNVATLSITSVPIGATVVLDGKAIGPTPQNIQVRPRQHNLVCEKAGISQ